MFTIKQIRIIRYAARGLIVACFVLAFYGYWEKESDLQDNERVNLFNKAFRDGYIVISQPAPGQPLEPATLVEFSQLTPADQKLYEEKRWERMRRQTLRFIAAVNQGLGDPFEYKETDDGRSYVANVKESSLRYRNPFEGKRPGPVTTPINSSEEIARSRQGWRIVSRDLVLYLKPNAAPVQVSAGEQFACEVGGEFLLASKSGSGTTLRISAEGQGKLQVLKLEARGAEQGRRPAQLTLKHGEYFVWDGRPFSIYRTDAVIGDADDPTVGDLVFTKMVNGKPLRVQVLGRATANLIGSPVGGETSYIDGSFLHNKARRLVLTIDPEIQSGAYYLLYSGLQKLDNDHPSKLQRPRKGSITVLDAESGQVLANVGTPGYDPQWEGDRVILANRQRVIENPANIPHMPGSSVKVLTGGIGYLMFGDGSGEMLPTSINKLAIRQAFRNAYGGPMPPDNIVESTEQADATEAGDRYFENNGKPQRIKQDFVDVLNSAFYVMHYKPEDYKFFDPDEAVRKELFEHVVFGDLERYFDASAKYSFFPQRSRFPVRDADSLELFRQYAIGASETRLTTLRLATILDEVTSGQIVHPFVVESVYDPAVKGNNNRVSNKKADVFTDLRTVLPNFDGARNGNEQRMTDEMRRYLEQVCIRDSQNKHTGWYHNANGAQIYMTEDDPATRDFNERDSRRGDFGKTGTADYGAIDPFNDSIFVYRHGRYIIAVWMERADGNGVVHPAHAMLDQVVKLIEKLEPPRS